MEHKYYVIQKEHFEHRTAYPTLDAAMSIVRNAKVNTIVLHVDAESSITNQTRVFMYTEYNPEGVRP